MSQVVPHTGKYRGLWEYLRKQESDAVPMSFEAIERLLGFALPASSRAHNAHWSGYKGSAVARAIADAGWRATSVNLTAETVRFVRRD
jgi:hypothetical protein